MLGLMGRRCSTATPSSPAISVLSAVEGLKLVTPAGRLRPADHGGDHRRPVPRAEPGHGQGRGLLRPDDHRLVPRHGGGGPAAHPRPPEVFRPPQPLARGELSPRPRLRGAGGAGRRVPRRDRRGGAVRRSRPFRAQADPGGLGLPRLPGARPQLSRAGRPGAGEARHLDPFFQMVPLGPAPHGDPRHHGHGGGEPGGDHRRLLAVAAGDPARPAAAPGDPPHLRIACGADLPAADQHAADGRRRAAGDPVQDLLVAGLGLRHRRDGHDAAHRLHDLPRDVADVGVVAHRGGGGDAAFIVVEFLFLLSNLIKVVEGGYVPCCSPGPSSS